MITGEVTWYPGMTLQDIEEAVIKKALVHYGGNRNNTAAALGIAVRTLQYKIDEYKKKEVHNVDTQEIQGQRV